MKNIVTPWDKRAIELEPVEGPYSHYAAWKEWLDTWNERQTVAMALDLDICDMVYLYAAFSAACEQCTFEDVEP